MRKGIAIMKKILSIAILAAMLCSAIGCEKDEPDFKDTVTVKQTTAAVTEEPAAKPVAISLEDVDSMIAAAKEEYAAAEEVTLSNGVVLSAAVKDPGITLESVENGTATAEQMNAYLTYISNVRQLICDRMMTGFPEENKLLFDENADISADFLFLDPVGDGFDTVGDAIAKMASKENDDDVVTDYIMIQNSGAVLLDADTNSHTLICPNNEENEILIAILQNLDPGAFTEKITETAVVTE